MRRKDLRIGDFVTCLHPVGVYGEQSAFLPQDVGTVASIDAGLPAPIIVDFYSWRIGHGSPHWHASLWRTCLRMDNIIPVLASHAHQYLEMHAPTWDEHLQKMLSWYGNSHYHAVGEGMCEPYPMYPAHQELVPFLQTGPSQQELLAFLSPFRVAFEWTGNRVQTETRTLVVANEHLGETRIPWTYK